MNPLDQQGISQPFGTAGNLSRAGLAEENLEIDLWRVTSGLGPLTFSLMASNTQWNEQCTSREKLTSRLEVDLSVLRQHPCANLRGGRGKIRGRFGPSQGDRIDF